MAWIERTAYPRLPASVSVRELAEAFTPTAGELAWAHAKTTSDQHRLALLVLLVCYQRLGYFPRVDVVAADVTGHVRRVAGLGAEVEPRYDSDRTLWRHREWIRDRLGVVYEPARVRAIAEEAMREALLSKDNPADVINVALEALARARCELPGYTTLDEMAGSLRAEVNGGFHRLVAGRLDAAERARVLGLLVVDPLSRRSGLAQLTQPAPKATVSRLKRHLALLRWLDELGPTGVWLAGIPPGKIAHFAGEAEVADAAELRDVGLEKRLTLLACLVHTARIRARDEVVTMFCKRMAAITKKAREHLEWLREQHRAESERLLGVFGDVLTGVREALGPSDAEEGDLTADAASFSPDPIGVVCERTGRMVLKTLSEAGGVDALSSTHEAVSAHHGNNYVPR
ncbi:MAG: DUF4158 domain-containing protein [Pseudonocardiaceae bacterium]